MLIQSARNHPTWLIIALTSSWLILLSACSSQPSKPTGLPPSTKPAPIVKTEPAKPKQDIAKKLQQASELIKQKNYSQATNILKQISPPNLTSEQLKNNHRLLSAKLAIAKQNYGTANELLQIDDNLLRQLPRPLQIDWFHTIAELYWQQGDKRATLDLLIQLEENLKPSEKIDTQEALIEFMNLTSVEELQGFSNNNANPQQKAWYQLGIILHQNNYDLTSKSLAIFLWKKQWPQHSFVPFVNDLLITEPTTPTDDQITQQEKALFPQGQISKIALLLPLSGNLQSFGTAIKEGFIQAARNNAKHNLATQLEFFDTTGSNDAAQLYTQAVRRGAQLVIGPLLKTKIADLNNLPQLTVPVLALNYLEDANRHANLFQLGLSIEDEIKHITEMAWQSGCLNALTIAAGNTWGQQALKQFSSEWEKYGGLIVENKNLTADSNYAKAVSELLQVSNQQVAAAKRYFNRELTPEEQQELEELGRRKDAECLFLALDSTQARAIRPLISFYLSNDLPLYATSRINDLTLPKRLNRDLTGVYFSEIPWLLNVKSRERNALRNKPEYQQIQRYERLYALGVDAFTIYPHLYTMYQNKRLKISGVTGNLKLESGNRVARNPSLVTFSNGKLVKQ